MKKITILLVLAFAFLASCNDLNAQVSKLYTNTDSTTSGTIATITSVEADTLYDANTYYTMYTKGSGVINDRSANYLVTFNVTKISGNGTGRVYLQGSMDGKVWENVNQGMIGTDGRNSDTLNIAAATTAPGVNYKYSSKAGAAVYRPATNAAVFYVNSHRYFYFRLKIVLTGTQVSIYKDGKMYTFD